jgi:tetratricopeptide (TPR) repeat protein
MKKTITLFILLLVCFRLSASAIPIDTNKVITPDAQKDSIKSLEQSTANLKFLTLSDFSIAAHPKNDVSLGVISHSPADLNYSVPIHHQDDFGLMAITYPDSLNFSPLAKHSGSLSMADSHLAENPDNQLRIRNADSLRLLAVLIRQDSIKSVIYKTNKDSVKQHLVTMSLDSLKQQLKLPAADLFKGQIYNEIATRYLDYDTISNRTTRINYQNKALNYTMLALRQYSHFNDTVGLRISFDHLVKVYMAQKKYSQAKWFILQSNSLSRAKNDPVNIIGSLITLSSIKSELSEYTLAMGDLNEALQIAKTNHLQKTELEVLKNYALLYSRLKNYPKEEAMLKKRDSLAESIRKEEEAKLTASLAATDSAEKKKADSVLAKKKVFTSNTRKLSKSGSARKVASL